MYDLRGDDRAPENVKVSIAGDWGTGTEESESVANSIGKFDPHFTIHIGDVYYVGDPISVNENCRGIRNPFNNFEPVTWPRGKKGSFALNGNHEMFANGVGYFDVFLPYLGLRDANGKFTGQQTSFFCLQNKFWRIIAVDTGYNSIGVPILSQIPGINSIPFIGGDCRLRDEQIAWLTEVVLQPSPDDPRGVILVSHHQNYSGFETTYKKPAKQLLESGITGPVIWFWGHEHRLAGYDLHGTSDLKSYGRCVGHGGMPIVVEPPKRQPTPVFYDLRIPGKKYGVNGFVNLTFDGPHLGVEYKDLTNTTVLRESWTVEGRGMIRMLSREKLINDDAFHVRPFVTSST